MTRPQLLDVLRPARDGDFWSNSIWQDGPYSGKNGPGYCPYPGLRICSSIDFAERSELMQRWTPHILAPSSGYASGTIVPQVYKSSYFIPMVSGQ